MTDTELARLKELEEELGADVAIELVELFLEDAPKQVETMRAGLEGGDAEGLKRAAHSLKGSCSNLGLKALAGNAAALEQHVAKQGIEGATPLLDAVGVEQKRLHGALETLAAELRAKIGAS